MASNNRKRSANFTTEETRLLIPGEEYHLDHQGNCQTKMSKLPLLPDVLNDFKDTSLPVTDMVWIKEDAKYTWLQRAVTTILKQGPLPRHMAIIMDGNRRYANKNSIERIQGHAKGFDKLTETLEWCRDLGITEVTVYAFSIENFNRSKDEVDGLMSLAEEKFEKLLEEKDQLEKHGVRVRIIGNLQLLPEKLRSLCAEITLVTASHSKACLNVCLSYTSRDEMTTAVQTVCKGVQTGELLESDVTEGLIERCLYTSEMPALDLLIRTSGEVRLSDFLMWQAGYASLSFVNVLWPEFTFWHLCAAVFHFQRNHRSVSKFQAEHQHARQLEVCDADVKAVLQDGEAVSGGCSLEERLAKYRAARENRVEEFVRRTRDSRASQLKQMASLAQAPQILS